MYAQKCLTGRFCVRTLMHMDSAVLASKPESNMTTASDILNISANANDADKRAQELTDDLDQDWEHEATLYTFGDGSVLVISGPQLNAFDDMAAARAALEA